MATKPWYMFPRIDNFGQIDPDGNYYKPDSNVQIPPGYPVTELLGGTVSCITGSPGQIGGIIITVRLDKPVNKLANFEVYQWMGSVNVHVGQHVNPGDLIAYNGDTIPLGFGFWPGPDPCYGHGSGWSVLQADLCPGCAMLLNPVSVIEAVAGGKPIPQQSGTGVGSSGTVLSRLDTTLLGAASLVPVLLVGIAVLALGLAAMWLYGKAKVV